MTSAVAHAMHDWQPAYAGHDSQTFSQAHNSIQLLTLCPTTKPYISCNVLGYVSRIVHLGPDGIELLDSRGHGDMCRTPVSTLQSTCMYASDLCTHRLAFLLC